MSFGPVFEAATKLFNEGRYLAAHELWEELWEANEGGDADFFKGLIQAAICMHHFEEGNLEGAVKLYRGHRRLLAAYVPDHAGIEVARFLEAMRAALVPVLMRAEGETVRLADVSRPRLELSSGSG